MFLPRFDVLCALSEYRPTAKLACVAVVSVSFKPSGASTKDARGHWAKRSKKVGAGEGAGKERKRLSLSPDILPNAVRQRTGGNDVLPLVNRLSIKLIDQNDIWFPFIKDKNRPKRTLLSVLSISSLLCFGND